MKRFYFHLYNDVTTSDELGEEHADLAAAEISARESVAEMIAEQIVRNGHFDPGHRIDIADATGKVLASRYFGDFIAAGS